MESSKVIKPLLLKTQKSSNAALHYSSSTFSKREIKRFLLKIGTCNIRQQVPKRQRYHLLEYNKLVESSWAFTITAFLLVLLSTWLGFAAIWWLICYTHGDFEPEHLPPFQKANNFKPCIHQVHNFRSCLMFSIETQHTVGYGIKATTDECPEAIFVNVVQCIFGFIVQGTMAVVIFSKMTHMKHRSQTLLFSKQAVIGLREGKLCFMFRIGDMRKKYHLVDANVRAFMIKSEWIKENFVQHSQLELELKMDGCKSLFFNWPVVLYHDIENDSALFYTTPSDLKEETFEIVVVLEGVVESTGQMIQTRTSYTSNEIVWGGNFEALMSYDRDRLEFEVDFSKFDSIKAISTPLCSAAYNNHFGAFNETKSLNFMPNTSLNLLGFKNDQVQLK